MRSEQNARLGKGTGNKDKKSPVSSSLRFRGSHGNCFGSCVLKSKPRASGIQMSGAPQH